MPHYVINGFVQTFHDIKTFVDRLESSTPDETVKMSLQTNPKVSLFYVAYRWLQFALHLSIYLVSFLDVNRQWSPQYTAPVMVSRGIKFYAKWFLYLTHWGVLLNLVQSLMGAAILTIAFKNRNNQTTNSIFGVPLKVAAVYRYLFGASLNLSSYITVGFWALVYDPDFFYPDVVTVTEHGMSSLLLLIDLVVVKFPYKLFNGVVTLMIALIYEQLVLIHYWSGSLDRYQDKPYLYQSLNWSQPWVSGMTTLAAVFSMLSFNFFLWGICQLKRQMAVTLCSHRTEQAVRSSSQPHRLQ